MLNKKAVIVCAAAAALSFAGATASAATTWSGQDWDATNNATLSVNGTNLDVTATAAVASGYSWGGAHVGTDNTFRAAATPYVQATFQDNGSGAYLVADQETGTPKAWLGIGALHSDDSTYSLKLTSDSSATSTVITLGARDNGEHTVLLGRRADGSVDFVFDGAWKYNSGPNVSSFFGDIYLNSRNAASGETANFTSFESGTNYDYTSVPEPSSLGLVGLAGLALLARRSRRSIA